MKNILLIIIFTAITRIVTCQDVIVMNSGEERQVVVKKVGVTIIEYVRFDNQAGALYEVLKSEVHKIRYQNGVEDVINTPKKIETTPQPEITKCGQCIDERDGTVYKTIDIGEQTWLAENLKFKYEASKCNLTSEGICDECGRYYTFEEALQACPAGWHLPSDKEWIDLEIQVGMRESEAAKTGWRGTHPGQAPLLMRTGKTGLELYMCGYAKNIYDSYSKTHTYDLRVLHEEAYYWTSTEKNANGFYRHFQSWASIDRGYFDKWNRLPVRCVKD